MARTKRLNETQLRLIQLFEFASTKKEEQELMEYLQAYYQKKFASARKRILSDEEFSQAKVDTYVRTHQHGKRITL